MNEHDVLGACELFSNLGSDGLRLLAAEARARKLDAGESLFHHGQQANGFYVVASGVINVHRLGSDGRRQVLHLLGPGEAVGEVAVFEGRDFPASAEAQEDAVVVYLPRERFLSIARKNPDILLNMLAALSARLRRFVALVDDLSLKDVGARLAQYLLEAAGEGAEVALEVSKGMLASQLGTISETLSRTLRKLQQRGIIRVDGRSIALLNVPALELLCEEGRMG